MLHTQFFPCCDFQTFTGIEVEKLEGDPSYLSSFISDIMQRIGKVVDHLSYDAISGKFTSASFHALLNAFVHSKRKNQTNIKCPDSSVPVVRTFDDLVNLVYGTDRKDTTDPKNGKNLGNTDLNIALARIQSLEAKVSSLLQAKQKLSSQLVRAITCPDTNKSSTLQIIENDSDDSPNYLDKIEPKRGISVNTLASQLSQKTDDFERSSRDIERLELTRKRQSSMFAQLFRVFKGHYTSAPLKWIPVILLTFTKLAN